MVTTIENEFVQLAVKRSGAEMVSLKGKKTDKEYLWQANPDFWPRRAPILFPIVGKLNENKYKLDGQEYVLPQHGFARNLMFERESESKNQVSYILKSHPETLKNFPFQFDLSVTYTLKGKAVEVKYEVTNKGKDKMVFTIGAHPGFNVPAKPDEQFEDYYLEFEKEENAERHLLEDGLFTGNTAPLLNNSKKIPLNHDLFIKDAIVLENLNSKWVQLKSSKSDYALKLDFSGFPYLGIWSPSNEAPFVCIEPWMGLADTKGFEGSFNEKTGVISLGAGATYSCGNSIELISE
jgi:galactose mutarotase-like enzyme